MNKYLYILLSPAIILCCSHAGAQTKDLGNEQIDVIKPYQPTLSDSYKISSLPEKDTATAAPPHFEYPISSTKVSTTVETTPLKPVKIKDETISKLYRTLVKAGFGNNDAPYGEVFVNSLRSREYSWGTHYRHLSSSGGIRGAGNSSYSDNEINLYGKRFFDNKSTLSGGINYTRNVLHYYGFDDLKSTADEIDTRQNIQVPEIFLRHQSNILDSARLRYDFRVNYYNLSDFYGKQEDGLSMNLVTGKFINTEFFGADVSWDYAYDQLLIQNNKNLLSLVPHVSASGDKWKVLTGINFSVQSDKEASLYHFFPKATFSYNIAEEFLIGYLYLDGNIRKNTLRSLLGENPFLGTQSLVTIQNTNNRFEGGGGLKGTLSNNTSFDVSGKYNEVSLLPLFVPDVSSSLQNKYLVIYDDAVIWGIHAELSHQQTEKIRISARGDYHHYTLSHELKAWHKPALQITLSGNYSIADKLVARADIYGVSSRYTRIMTPAAEAKKINGFVDVNAGLEYNYTRIMSFFLNFNNIAGLKYYTWENYPVQRFQVMGGLSYAF